MAPVDSTGTLERLSTPAPVEPTGAESYLEETGLTLQNYAYFRVKGRRCIGISYAIACVKIAPKLCRFLTFLDAFLSSI